MSDGRWYRALARQHGPKHDHDLIRVESEADLPYMVAGDGWEEVGSVSGR